MLKLKRVELQGFKSFCDRTELKFNGEGIAAIVGPNGCGKSNLSDAISWVLGEQSAKSLRGARMEDVIFAGTRERKPVGMAAVTMTLRDPEAHAAGPITDVPTKGANGSNGILNGQNGHAHHPTVLNGHSKNGEITITRRLFRSGESEYLIDGRQARLRDIQDIFMGSGLGPESYAIIEQGRIGQILSSKPQDRRAVIEEAAGISKYKSRKRLAESRLESAKQNLARVFDILEEVTRQVNSLKRQAAKAKRYGELKIELDARLRAWLTGQCQVLERETARASADLEAASEDLRRLLEQAASDEAGRGDLQAACYDLEEELTRTRRRLAESNVEAERTRGRLESQVKESGALEERMTQGEQDVQQLDGRLEVLGAERATLAESVAGLEAQIAAARRQMAEKNQAREQIQARVREREQAIESGRLLVLRLLGEAANLKNQLAQIDEYLAGIERETGRAQREEQSAAIELERLGGVKKGLSQAMSQRQMELESVTGERQRTETDLGEQKRAAAGLRGEIDQLREECSHLKARKESIENVLSHHSYTTETVKHLLSAMETGQAGEFRHQGVLADFVEVDAGWERAAEQFLHQELEYVVVSDWEQAERGMQLLQIDLEGRATFLVEKDPSEAPSRMDSGYPGLPRLTDHLRLTNGLGRQALGLLPRLANCYLTLNETEARMLARQYPALFFLLPDGRCYHARTLSGGQKKASGPLALKRELRELSAASEIRERELAGRSEAFEQLSAGIAQLETELERLRGEQQAREKDALALEHDLRKLTEETARTNSRVSVARLELERLQREQERSIEQRNHNRTVVDEKDAERGQRESALESARLQLEEAEAEAARIGEEYSTLRAELAALEERHRAERAGLSRTEIQFHEMAGRRQEIGREIERLGEHRARLLNENIELDRRSALLAEDIIQMESDIARQAAETADQRQKLLAADEALKDLRARIEAGHQKRSEIEVDLVRRQSELKFLDETSRKELGLSLEELKQGAGEAALPEWETLTEMERLYQEMKARVEALGAVNPDALPEFEEAQQRHDFLSAQRTDLIDSIRDTEKAIQEIDQVSRTRFSEAFEAVNANFRAAFQTLFGGGSGEMRLTDETNAGESGIDIIASPPGKKLQNVLLLSGGEKALAALALLMAIFRYQPSPFCVLDEVDAPLDEANIGRLMNLLKEMALETQFVLITHSKKTMESAESMYGVTMQEAGVSKLVSVRFHASADREILESAKVLELATT